MPAMTALDTNVLIRYVTRDEPTQFAAARRVIETRTCFVPDTVVLETVWVLESIYGFDRGAIADALRKFFGMETVQLADAERLHRVIGWYKHGMDFGDAMHLALSENLDQLITFDRAFIRKAQDVNGCRAVHPDDV